MADDNAVVQLRDNPLGASYIDNELADNVVAPGGKAKRQKVVAYSENNELLMGTDGTTPPTITGTGVRGWLRAIYERLTSGVATPPIVASTANSTALALAAGGSFVGTGEDVSAYNQINLKLYGRPNTITDATNAMGSLFFEFSDDNAAWDISVPIVVRTLGVFIPYPLINVGKFFRVRYLNDGGAAAITILGTGETVGTPTAQTVFRLTTYKLPHATTGLARTLDQSVTGSDPVTLTKATIVGQTPDRFFNPLRATADNVLRVRDDAHEIFGSLITSTRVNQIEIRFDKTFNAAEITNTTSGSGSATQTVGHAVYATGATNNGSARGVSVATIVYKVFNTIFAGFTASFVTPTHASSFERIGPYDDNNGLFVGYEGTTFGVTLRSGAVDQRIARSAWNGDKLDGSAASDFTRNGVPEAIDLTKSNVYQVTWGHLGSAIIVCQVMAPDGHFVTFHTFRQPNTQLAPSTQNPDLPMTVHVSKTSADGTNLQITTGSWGAGTTADLSGSSGSLKNGAETAVSSAAVQVLAANSARKRAVIQNTGNANVRVGITGVTAATGVRVVPNGLVILENPNCEKNAVYAIREGAADSIVFATESV